MAVLELQFESGEDSLSVREFVIDEVMSGLFAVSIVARSKNDDIDFETIVGRPASFRITSGVKYALVGKRVFHGICQHIEQLGVETTGLSTYHLRIVPKLWLLGERTNNRLFQHTTIPDIIEKLLLEWDIPHHFAFNRQPYQKLELRTQYGESDLAFLHRLLEEAGISYSFSDEPPEVEGASKPFANSKTSPKSVMVLHDAPQSAEPRPSGPLKFVDNPNQSSEKEFVTRVRIAQQVKPGKVSLRDHDFRRHSSFVFVGTSSAQQALEESLERYRYAPGAFLVELGLDDAGKLGDLFKGGLGGILGSVGGIVGGKLGDKLVGFAGGKIDDFVGDTLNLGGKDAGDLLAGNVPEVLGDKLKGLAGGTLEKALGDFGLDRVLEFAGGGAFDFVAGRLWGGLGRLFGDDKGIARHTEKAAKRRADITLEALRVDRRTVFFETNAIDLCPGTVLSIGQHSRSDLGPDERLLVVKFSIRGTHDGDWKMAAETVFAKVPYRTPQRTPKPVMHGMQSAIVVGPPGEEIHTDEYGRVRVQFHWDREGTHDENSSCWLRVSQGWAGAGYGMIMLPRVGQEVLVGYLEGNPDLPMVMGRAYNGTSPVPYDLPGHKTRSGWRSNSSPGSGGYNEIMFEDAKGRELFYQQAERDLETLVKRNEARSVGKDRRTTIEAVDESLVGARYNVTMRQLEREESAEKIGPTFFEMVDRRIVFSTGEASITLDGPNITLEAKGRIFVHSTDDDVEILGGPWVKINCGPVKEGESDTVTMHHITGIVQDQDEEPLANWKVVVQGSDGAIQQVTTDANGRYFALVPPGKCKVSVPGKLRYGPAGSKVDDMTFESEEFDDCGPVT